ncbi:MAG: hypothetical protein KDA57_19965 [Planctomycetales bacterium]|nr:hypothetical protein [Planctomycetales bacterium]
MSDEATAHLPGLLRLPFKELSTRLQGDYGGVMEHLWIDFELIESLSRSNGRPRHEFRFTRRVSGRSRFGLPSSPDQSNVGHYSVRPDFHRIVMLPNEEAISYALSAVYGSTEVLFEKQEKLGGFDAGFFRRRFLCACQSIGYEIS